MTANESSHSAALFLLDVLIGKCLPYKMLFMNNNMAQRVGYA